MAFPTYEGTMDGAIFESIEAGINRCSLIADEHKFNKGAVNKRLHRLEEKHELYSRKSTVDGHSARLWFIGPDPAKPTESAPSSYPVISGREFFVFALFGAPKASQAQGAA